MDLSSEQIRWILISVFVLLISVALHEFGHAIVAHKLGDDTPSRQGRVTLNPLAHADPIGTFVLPLIGGLYGAGGFGWGKPVQWQPHRITRKISMSLAKIMVAVAGPSMNLLLGVTVAIVHTVLVKQGVLAMTSEVNAILLYVVKINFILFFFNLLPIPPLDGGHVVQSFVPYRHRAAFDNFAKYAPFLLIAIMLIPRMSLIFVWPATHLTQLVYQLFGQLLGVG